MMRRRDFFGWLLAPVALAAAGCARRSLGEAGQSATGTTGVEARGTSEGEAVAMMGYCGVDCAACRVFQATRDDDDALRAKCAEEWAETARQHWGRDSLRPEEMSCRGCRHDGDEMFIGCRKCPIRRCCKDRGLAHCGLCDELSTCQRIAGLLKDCPEAATNLKRAATK